MTGTLKFDDDAQLALVKLGEKPPAQAAAFLTTMTPAERLQAANCQQEGDKLRLIMLLDHVATRQHFEADLSAYEANEAKPAPGPEDDTDLEE